MWPVDRPHNLHCLVSKSYVIPSLLVCEGLWFAYNQYNKAKVIAFHKIVIHFARIPLPTFEEVSVQKAHVTRN